MRGPESLGESYGGVMPGVGASALPLTLNIPLPPSGPQSPPLYSERLRLSSKAERL